VKGILAAIVDLVLPRRPDAAAIARLSPEEFLACSPRRDGPAYPGIHAVFRYRDPAATAMIRELKSAGSRHAARLAAYGLASFLEESGIREAVIVPMPLSARRRRERGYNQCELLAEHLLEELRRRSKGSATGFMVDAHLLERVRQGPKSALQGRAGRIAAARGAFRARDCTALPRGVRIILIDDVVTTGSTMGEALCAGRERRIRSASRRPIDVDK
jgi:predicted amidophosphoribosyltransferase